MEIERIPRKIEEPFRDALGHAIRSDSEHMRRALLDLTDEQWAACQHLCAFVTGYVAIDASGRQWPDDADVRKVADRLPRGDGAESLGLRAGDFYTYIKRVALGFEPVAKVFPTAEDAVALSLMVTGRILTACCPQDLHWREFLSGIEEAYEAALAADLRVLPALMLRSRRFSPAFRSWPV